MLTVSEVMSLKKRKDIEGLIRALQYQGDTAVRAEAALSLGQMGDVQAVDSLISVLQSDSDPYVRSLAATALGSLGDPRAREVLLSALQNDTLEVGAAASKAMSKLRG